MKRIRKNRKSLFVSDIEIPGAKDFWSNLEKNLWENDSYAAFDTFLDQKHSYIDIGAWVGPTVLYSSQLARHCYAVEPDPVAFKMLQDNLDLNPVIKNKISLFNVCIGPVSGSIKLGTKTEFGDSRSSIQFNATPNSITSASLTINDFISKNSITDCNFIKMDIEGGEAKVLPAMKDYLNKDKPIFLLSLHPFLFEDRIRDSKEIIEVLKIYKHIFYAYGKQLDRKKLQSILIYDEKVITIIAADKWGLFSRLLYGLKNFKGWIVGMISGG